MLTGRYGWKRGDTRINKRRFFAALGMTVVWFCGSCPARLDLRGDKENVMRPHTPNACLGCGLLILVVAVFLAHPVPVSGDCIAGKPVKVSGRFCGRVFDQLGAIVPNAKLDLVDETEKRSVVAETRADADRNFAFPPVAPGKYWLQPHVDGWSNFAGEIQVTGRGGKACRYPFHVTLGIQSCEGGISKKKAPNFREPGSHGQAN